MTHEEVLDEINIVYERISHSEDFVDGNYTEALEILIDFYETGLIEELEKIKAEISKCPIEVDYPEIYINQEYIYKILNDAMSELKGEQYETD